MTLATEPFLPFDEVSPSIADRVLDLESELYDATQLNDLPKIEPLVEDTYGRHSYIVLAGRNATYKTFVALDLALSHCTGKLWQGRKVEQGRVLYMLGEGAYGLDDRIQAWLAEHNLTLTPGMLTILPRTVRLFNNHEELEALVELVRRGGYVLVVIDTLRRATGGAKGNSNDDMGEVVDAIEDIKRATENGSVLVVAHTDAEDSKVRGATNIEDDADYVYRMKRNGAQIKLWRTKNKYGPEEDVHLFKPKLIANSLVLEADTIKVMRLEDRERAEARTLLDIIDKAGGTFRGFTAIKNAAPMDNNRVKPALDLLEQERYIEVRPIGNSREYVKLRDWGTEDGGS
ncbi:AAA family ATPase [Micromonospora aurantiaca (nom. illeg.)]|uniref:AAA family ATPase n=1 Tax=Micromonospora aurantiaca (nom. illeg.) TaxID=47850 RepID=UPI0036BCB71E